jgi:hypothetical protein
MIFKISAGYNFAFFRISILPVVESVFTRQKQIRHASLLIRNHQHLKIFSGQLVITRECPEPGAVNSDIGKSQ